MKRAGAAILMVAAFALCLQISGCSSSGNPAGPDASGDGGAPPATEPEAPPPESDGDLNPPLPPGGEPEPETPAIVGVWVGLVTIPTGDLTLKFSVRVDFKADGSFTVDGAEGIGGSGAYELRGNRVRGSGTMPGMEPGTAVRVDFEGTLDGDRITGDWRVGDDHAGTFRLTRK